MTSRRTDGESGKGGWTMSDKITEIRKRHENVAWRYIELPVIYEDRAFLLDLAERQRAEIERLREVIRTIRARCVELDDSDAVSETLDIATAVLEDEPCA